MREIKKRLDAARELALGAGSLLKVGFGGSIEFERKPDGSLVSPADKAAEKLILGELKKRFPSDSTLSEESGRAGCDDELKGGRQDLEGGG